MLLYVHVLLSLLTVVLGLAIKPTSRSLRTTFFFIALSIFLPALFTPYPDIAQDVKYQTGLVGSFLLAVGFDLLVLQDNPQENVKPNKQVTPASQLGFISRMKWAAALLINIRGANWNIAIPGLQFSQEKTRWGYVTNQLLWVGYYYLLGDIVGAFTRRNSAFQYPPTESLGAHGLVWQAVNVMLFWLTLVAFMELQSRMAYAVSVALRLYDPEDWPVYFGVWKKTKSIRTFWGRSWHQNLRRSFQPQSKYLTQHILHLSPKSLSSTYIQLFTCFFLSGVYHAAADWLVSRNPSSAIANVNYFLKQGVIIAIEDFIIFLGKKVGVNGVPSVVSYVWVLGWMTLVCPMWIRTMVEGDNFMLFAPKVSMVEKVLERVWGN